MTPNHPVQFDVEYPDDPDRLSTAFRLVFALPTLVLLAALGGTAFGGGGGDCALLFIGLASGLVVIPRRCVHGGFGVRRWCDSTDVPFGREGGWAPRAS